MKLFLDNPHLSAYFGLVVTLFLLFGVSFLVPKFSSARKWLGISLIFAPVIYFFLILDAHLVNIPFTDDFNLLETVYNYQQAPDFTSKIEVLFEQVNQHRFAFERIVMLVMVFFAGTVNIKTQIILGDLALLGMAYLLFKSLKKENLSFLYFIPVPYLLFSLIFWENAYWGIAALQNTPLIFFAFLTAYSVGRGDSRGFYFGILAALLTTFASGSGLLAWIIGAVILLFQKRYKLLTGWLIAAAGVILFYFLFDYQVIPATGEKAWTHPLYNFIFVLGFWGNAFYLDIRHPLVSQFQPDLVACVLLGGLIFLLFLGWSLRILTQQKRVWSDWFLWGAMMFSMGTGAMFVISRPLNNYFMFGGNMFSRRYMIFGATLLAVAYVCLVLLVKNRQTGRKWIAVLIGIGFVTLNFVSYYSSIVQVRKMHDDLVIDSYHWKNYNTFLTAGDLFGDIPFWNHPTRMKNLVNNLESSGLSDFYQFNTLPSHRELIAKTDSRSKFRGDFNATFHYRNTDNNIPTKYYRFMVTPPAGSAKPSYFILSSDTLNLVLPAVPAPNKFADFIKTGSYYSNTSHYGLFNLKLPKGEFRVYILSQTSGDWKSEFTGKRVVIN